MHFKVLAVGDITGESGVAFLRRHLGRLKQEKGIDFAVVNAENAAGNQGRGVRQIRSFTKNTACTLAYTQYFS